MDFVRCPECQAPLSKKSKTCHRCGHASTGDKGTTFGDVGRSVKAALVWTADVVYKMTSWLDVTPDRKPADATPQANSGDKPMTAAEFEQALKDREKQREPARCAWIGCLFALIGIFFLAVVFVPLAVLFTGAGLIGSLLRGRVDAFFVSLLGVILIGAAFLTSPSLWLLIGLSST